MSDEVQKNEPVPEAKPQFYAVERDLLIQVLTYLKQNPVTDLYVKLDKSVPVILNEVKPEATKPSAN